jgi:mono/diheme cytochrome c family protein
MRNFVVGFVIAAVLLLGGSYLYARLGFVDPGADIPVSTWEANQAMAVLNSSIDRRAPETKNPVAADEANLTAGMKLYQSNCAGCHGDVNHAESPLADAFYPRAPQFQHDAPDMPDNENFYLIKHGIRWSGMPAWKQLMTDQQIWQVCVFLDHMNKLPPDIGQQWRAIAK